MNDNAGSKANGDKSAPRSIRIEFAAAIGFRGCDWWAREKSGKVSAFDGIAGRASILSAALCAAAAVDCIERLGGEERRALKALRVADPRASPFGHNRSSRCDGLLPREIDKSFCHFHGHELHADFIADIHSRAP